MTQTLNGPLEVGVRITAQLVAMYPSSADMDRLVLLDHVVIHSGDFSERRSLHPQIPGRSGELGLKRELVTRGLQLMGARGLIVRAFTPEGVYYRASDDALPFLQAFDSTYLDSLRVRCSWAAENLGTLDDRQIRQQLRAAFGQWAEEFDWINREFRSWPSV